MAQAPDKKRRRVNLSISTDVMEQAKALSLNASKAAEAGIESAIRKAKEEAWRDENKDAIAKHNARVERDGMLLTPEWTKELDGTV
ncbi:MAG: type II toxin-antitoxin system CcdA family antitoxin [Sphingomonadales bacterium]